MIKTLEVKNFKSIKYLKLNCKRINLFIGKPNTGKSNILESVGIFSFPYSQNLKDIVRFENMTNLFYDQATDEKIEITADSVYCEIKFENGLFRGSGRGEEKGMSFNFNFEYNFAAQGSAEIKIIGISPFKIYRFTVIDRFPRQESNFLLPPKGENLLSLLLTNKALRKMATDIFSEYGLRIVLKPQEGKIDVQKEVEDVIISYPYSLTSDTLQRLVFHIVAVETNKDSIITFEEPEVHTFPFYTKFFAERIALDSSNQYFISTHNPYLLLSVLEKAPKDDTGIFIVYFKDYQTKVRVIMQEEMPEVLDLDASIFFNLDQFVKEE